MIRDEKTSGSTCNNKIEISRPVDLKHTWQNQDRFFSILIYLYTNFFCLGDTEMPKLYIYIIDFVRLSSYVFLFFWCFIRELSLHSKPWTND